MMNKSAFLLCLLASIAVPSSALKAQLNLHRT
jgi:hypothetical protein